MPKQLKLTLVTPELTALKDKPADFIVIPGLKGEIGILPGHAPLLVQLGNGLVRYKTEGKEEVYGIMRGFAEVYQDKVLVLAADASLGEQLNEESEKQAIRIAKEQTHIKGDEVDIDEAEASLNRAIVNLKIAQYRKKKH